MNSDTQDPIVIEARRRLALKSGWYRHALIYALVNLGLWALSLYHGGGSWHYFPLLGWGIGLAIHGAAVLSRLRREDSRNRRLDAEVETLRRRSES